MWVWGKCPIEQSNFFLDIFKSFLISETELGHWNWISHIEIMPFRQSELMLYIYIYTHVYTLTPWLNNINLCGGVSGSSIDFKELYIMYWLGLIRYILSGPHHPVEKVWKSLYLQTSVCRNLNFKFCKIFAWFTICQTRKLDISKRENPFGIKTPGSHV